MKSEVIKHPRTRARSYGNPRRNIYIFEPDEYQQEIIKNNNNLEVKIIWTLFTDTTSERPEATGKTSIQASIQRV